MRDKMCLKGPLLGKLLRKLFRPICIVILGGVLQNGGGFGGNLGEIWGEGPERHYSVTTKNAIWQY